MSENELVTLPRAIVDPREEVEALMRKMRRALHEAHVRTIPAIFDAEHSPIPPPITLGMEYLARLVNEHTVRAVYPFCRDKDGNLCVAVPTKPFEPVYKQTESKINEKTNP